METLANYINGELIPPVGGAYLDNIEPATGQIYSLIPDSNADDVALAVEAAQRAYPAWSALSVDQRAKLLSRLAQAIDDQHDALALAESIDNGKPLTLAKAVDIQRASDNIRFFAHAISQFASESHSMPGAINYTLRDPIGVVGCISPWNLPLYLFTWKIAPALAAGNCVIAKPSEITPMTAYLLSKLCQQIGLPPGVLNIVHGLGDKVGNSIVSHPAIKAISFTGGTTTGRKIAAIAAPMFKKLSLELGGKNPALVFADSDIDDAVKQLARAAFANQGQICLCASRIYIERSIYPQFRDAFVARVSALKVGDPLAPDTDQGALVSKAHMAKVLAHIAIAKQEGGICLTGGEQVVLSGRCAEGYFVAPTVFEGLDIHHCTNQQEIFGPVTTLQPFDNESHGLTLANGNDYGLAATVFSSDISRCHRLAQQIDCGIIWVNSWLLRDLRVPFGGMKQSGVGREGGLEALRFFTEAKNVCIKF